jgi:DNA primase catalytic core
MIPQQTIDQILSAANIVDVIGEFMVLKKAGSNYRGLSPFTSEKTPSFFVNPAKGIFKCFSSGIGGNVIFFLQEHEKISFPEAVKWLGKKYGIEIPEKEIDPAEKQKADARERMQLVNAWALRYFESELKKPEAAAYIKQRNISPEMVKKFRLGYALKSWTALIECARLKEFNEQMLIDASLAGRNKKGNPFDWFRNRLMFPFFDMYGNVTGFTGRIIEANDQEAKYLNSSDTLLFNKGRTLFGLYQAKAAIIKNDECYLVEGNLDVVSFHDKGIENTVCGSGTALTVEQIRLIRRFTNNITIVYDGDAAGIKASFRSIDLMLQENINVRVVPLPDGEDPDSFAQRKTAKQLAAYLEKYRQDFITFKYNTYKQEILKDPLRESELIKELLASIAVIPDPVTRNTYKRICADQFKIDPKVIKENVSDRKKQKSTTKLSGWIGLDMVEEIIRENDEVYITSDIDKLHKEWESGNENTIAYAGEISFSHIQELNVLTRNVFVLDAISRIYDDNDKPTHQVQLCKMLFEFGLNVKIPIVKSMKDIEDSDTYDGDDYISFLMAYFNFAEQYITANQYDNDKVNMAIEEAAELLSKADNTTIHVNCSDYARKLGIKEGDFKKVLKPFLEKKKSKSLIQNEVSDAGESMYLDPDRLPDYVDKDFFSRWGYFPFQNKSGKNVRYVFRTQDGGLQVIGNFYIDPLFHVYDPDPEKNKRVFCINAAERNESRYIEMKSGIMADFSSFKKAIFNEGGFIFTKGKSNHFEAIQASMFNMFPLSWELNVFGQQHEGFWAFANAIFTDGKVTYMNDLGLVLINEKTFYSPAFSKIYSGHRKDNDKFEQDRFFIYRETSQTSFQDWARLMNEVYKLNDNGKWAVLFAIMSTFRSIIYPIDRLFTSLFFIGPTESGKSQVAISIRSLFIKPEAPLFNLNSGTDAAFFTTLERYRDVPIIFEEYNDIQISDIKFQGLKAAVYDGEGKQKRKDATSKDLDISKVNAVPVLLGQEAPERDDGSLGNRCVICHVPKKDDWSEAESEQFRNLKEREQAGLSNVLIEILKQRNIVSDRFKSIQRQVFKEIKEDLSKNGRVYQTRIVNTVSLFLAICKLWEEYVKELKLPFTYKEFYDIARAKIISMSEAIVSTNRVSVFFDTIELLLNRPHGGLIHGKEFKIEVRTEIIVQKNKYEEENIDLERPVKVLYMRLNILHPLYMDIRKAEALKMNNLVTYLKDHPAYLGMVKSTRFKWTEIHEISDPATSSVKKHGVEASVNTSAIAFNYDLLHEMMNIDLEKFSNTEVVIENKTDEKPKKTDEDGSDDLPF